MADYLYSGGSTETTASPQLTGLINSETSTNANKIAANYGSGIEEGRGLLNAPDNFNKNLSYGDAGTLGAIKSKYNQEYNQNAKQLSTKLMSQANTDQIKRLAVASQAADQEVELNRQKEFLKYQKSQANKKARGAVLGHVLGIVGGVVAGAYTAGAGAPAGFMAGEAAGNAIGGT